MEHFPSASYLAIEPLNERQQALETNKQRFTNFDYALCVAGAVDGNEVGLNVTSDLDGSTVEGQSSFFSPIIDPLSVLRALARVFVLLWIGIALPDAHGNAFYVSPDGDDSNPGRRESPWRSLEHASRVAVAGDTVLILPGEYVGRIEPVNSGEVDAPITFKADQPRTARLLGPEAPSTRLGSPSGESRDDAPVILARVAHIHIEGLHIEPDPKRSGSWIYGEDTSHIVIRDNRFRGARQYGSIRIVDSTQVRILDNDFSRDGHGGDMVQFRRSNRLLIEGNSFTRGLHTSLGIHEARSNSQVVVRNNIFHSGWSRNFASHGTLHLLLDGNIFTNSFNGGRSATTRSHLQGDPMVFRFNVIARNFGAPTQISAFHREHFTRNSRFYHNVFANNVEEAFGAISNDERMKHVHFINNIFHNSDMQGAGVHLVLTGGNDEDVRFLNNVFYGKDGLNAATPIIDGLAWGRSDWSDGFTLNLAEAQSATFRRERGEMFVDNFHADPRFIDDGNFDFRLRPDSKLINRGRFLTRVRGEGSGRELAVEDPYPFYDGYGITGEQGDVIAVGSCAALARVVAIDHARQVLHLDRELTWKTGDPVSFPWSGAAPDIGAHEHGTTGRASVRVAMDRLVVKPGEPVTFRAHVHGLIGPLAYHWQLGDDQRAEGDTVTHRYEHPNDYGVRIRVTDIRGRSLIGVGYVVVNRPRTEGTLVHTTFREDDDEWFVFWQLYSDEFGGGSADWEHLLDPETGEGRVRLYATADGARLPAVIHPRAWDIDAYPKVRIRYRIKPGTPIGIHIRAFQTPGEGRRSFNLAGTSTAPGGDQRLVDDGEWHTIELDVRGIREKHPDVRYLYVLRIGSMETIDGGPRVREGDEYWLDEIRIGD